MVLAASVLLAACGVRGPLQTPPASSASTSSAAPPEPQATASAESGQGKPAGAAAKPHSSFILDGLLR